MTDAVAARVVDVFRAHTMYPTDKLQRERDLEGELGIDSVVLQSIIADLRKSFALPDDSLRGGGYYTIGDVIDRVAKASAGAAPPPAAPDRLAQVVLEAVRRRTGTQATLDARFDDDLGMDSLLLEAVLADVVEVLQIPATQLGARRFVSPRQVVDAVRGLAEGSAQPWDSRSMKDFVEEASPDLFAKVRSFAAYHDRRRREGLFWYGMPSLGPCKNRVMVFDEVAGRRREMLMFASNNYLGLANHPSVIDAICDATRRYGATNTGCRLIGGTNELHKELERRLARFKGTEACLIYPSGYSANLGAISALVKSRDAVIVDKYNHMSIVDGAKLSGGQRRIYGHNDMADLERVLAACDGQVDGKLIVTDGVFSMHGDVAPLPEIVKLARKHGARVLVDDAHATGVLGKRGSGTSEHFGLAGGADVDLELGTMSKTLGGLGGFVCGNGDVVEYLRFYSNSYVFAANIPAGVAAGLIASLDVLEKEPDRVTRLWENIRHLKGALEREGFDTGGAESAIIPIVIGDDRKTLEMGREVRARGLFCQTVVFPGVSVGDARLRVSVSAEHTREDLDLAHEIFVAAARATGVLPARA